MNDYSPGDPGPWAWAAADRYPGLPDVQDEPDVHEVPEVPAWLAGAPLPEAPGWPVGVWDAAPADGWRLGEAAVEGWRLGDAELLARAARAQRDLAAAQAEWLRLLAEIERRGASVAETAMPTASWLASGTSHSARAARAEVLLAGRLDAFPQVSAALLFGDVSLEQAQVMVAGLDRLPEELDRAQVHAVADELVRLAADFNPPALRRLVNRAVEVVAPEAAEEADRRALHRSERAQQRDRYLAWRRTDDGGVAFHGQLPAVEGELLVNQLTHIGARLRTADALAGVETTRPQGWADALALVLAHHAGCAGSEVSVGEWGRVIVSLDLEALVSGVGAATLLASGERVSAGQARRVACSAGIAPTVLADASLPLDFGRSRRFFSATQRMAIALRDGGCAFPGCDRPPGDCDVHHIEAWGSGGLTDLANGVMVCTHHHHVVEPDPGDPPDRQWVITFDARGNPEFASPARADGVRTLRQHHRFRQ